MSANGKKTEHRRGGSPLAASLGLCLLAAVTAVVPASAARAGEGDTPAPLAVVGDGAIEASDLEGYLDLRPTRGDASRITEDVRQRLEEMVVAELLYQEALRRGVDRDPQVRQTIRQVLAQRLLEREVDLPEATRKIEEAELKRYHEEHRDEYVRPEQRRAAEIFFPAPAAGDAGKREAQRDRAEEVLAEARALADARFGFGELLLKHSSPQPGRTPGDSGFFGPGGDGNVPPEFAAAAFTLERPGSILPEVVASAEGFHILMLTGRRDALSRSFEDEDVRREIESRIRAEGRRNAQRSFVQRLRDEAPVSVDETALEKIVAAMAPPETTTGAGRSGGALQAPPTVPEAGR